MLFSESWLRSYINPDLTTDELCEAMTMAGLEVEEVSSVAPAFSGVVVARVLSVKDHENSDHLHICQVDVGDGGARVLRVVTGNEILPVSRTIANLLSKFFYVDVRVKMAAMLLAMIPPMVIYVIFQKRVIEGMTMSSVKG